MSQLVSIGVPTFNRAEQLQRAVAGCLAQTYENIEVVISDNASTDDTRAVCDAWRSDPRITVIRQERNIGREPNFEAVLHAATGEFFMWLSDDDWMEPDYVKICATVLASDPACVSVGGIIEYVGPVTSTYDEPCPGLAADDPVERVVAYLRAVGLNGQHYGVMRRDVVLRAYYPATLAGDWMFVAQMAAAGKLIAMPFVRLLRAVDGVSSDMGDLAASYGMRRHWGRDMHLWVVLLFAPSLLRGRGAFAGIPVARRVEVARLVAGRYLRLWWLASGRQRVGIHALGRVRHFLKRA